MNPSIFVAKLRQIASKIDASKNPSKELVLKDIKRLASSLRSAAGEYGKIEKLEVSYEPDWETEGNLIISIKGEFLGKEFDLKDIKKYTIGCPTFDMDRFAEDIADSIGSEIEIEDDDAVMLKETILDGLNEHGGNRIMEDINDKIASQLRSYNADRDMYG